MKLRAALFCCLLLFAQRPTIGRTGAGILLVVNSGEDTLAIIDLDRSAIARKIRTRRHPQDVVLSADGKAAYVAEMGTMESPEHSIAVVDIDSRRIVRRFDLGSFGLAHLLHLTHDGSVLWAACAPQHAIVELDTRHGTIGHVWDTQQKGSYLFAVTPDESRIYAANFDSGTLTIFRRSEAAGRVLPWIGTDVSPDGRELWVANFMTNEIAIVNTAQNIFQTTIPAGGDGPGRLRFTPDGGRLVVTLRRSNEVALFDVRQRRILWKSATGHFPKGLFVSRDGRYAFVGLVEDGQVAVFDLETGKEIKRIRSGTEPEGLAVLEE